MKRYQIAIKWSVTEKKALNFMNINRCWSVNTRGYSPVHIQSEAIVARVAPAAAFDVCTGASIKWCYK